MKKKKGGKKHVKIVSLSTHLLINKTEKKIRAARWRVSLSARGESQETASDDHGRPPPDKPKTGTRQKKFIRGSFVLMRERRAPKSSRGGNNSQSLHTNEDAGAWAGPGKRSSFIEVKCYRPGASSAEKEPGRK